MNACVLYKATVLRQRQLGISVLESSDWCMVGVTSTVMHAVRVVVASLDDTVVS